MAGTNPILDELSGLSPEAQQALRGAHAAAALAPQPPPVDQGLQAPSRIPKAPQMGAPPPTATPQMPNPTPSLSAPAAPQPTAPRGTLQGDINARGEMENHPAGITQIHSKIEGAMPNHPKLGAALGYAAEVPLRGLEAVGATLAPGRTIESLTPGTQLHRQQELRNLTGQIGEESKENLQGAQAGEAQARTGLTTEQTAELPKKTESEENLQGAQAENLRSETQARTNPKANWEVHDSEEGPILFNKTDGTAQHLSVDGQPVGPKLKLTQSQPIIGPDGKPHTYMLDEKGNKKIDLGVHYERPITVNAGSAAEDRLAARLAKPYESGFEAGGKQIDNIDKTIRSINSGYKGQALALPETLTSLVSGQGTGVRVTMPELQMIGQHNGIKGDIESFFNRISGEGSMTAEDKRQLSAVLNETKQIVLKKQAIHKEALDRINGAGSREEVAQADKAARDSLMQLEQGGNQGGGAPQHKVGDTVSIKGRQMKITAVHPDGSFDAN